MKFENLQKQLKLIGVFMKVFFTKRIAVFALLGIFSAAFSFAQQITKFAVVDTAKVYQAYFRNSAPVRNYENKKEEFKREIDRLVAELQRLNDQKIEFERIERERRIAIEEEKIRKKREKEELLRKEAIKAKEEFMKEKEKNLKNYLSSISASISLISPNRIYCDMNSDILGVNSRISDLDNISDNIIKVFDDTERLINTCISDIDAMSDRISRYVDINKLF